MDRRALAAATSSIMAAAVRRACSGLDHSEPGVLLVMLSHAVLNAISGEFFLGMFSGLDAERYGWLLAGIYGLVALAVIVKTGPDRLSSRPPAPAEGPYRSPGAAV